MDEREPHAVGAPAAHDATGGLDLGPHHQNLSFLRSQRGPRAGPAPARLVAGGVPRSAPSSPAVNATRARGAAPPVHAATPSPRPHPGVRPSTVLQRVGPLARTCAPACRPRAPAPPRHSAPVWRGSGLRAGRHRPIRVRAPRTRARRCAHGPAMSDAERRRRRARSPRRRAPRGAAAAATSRSSSATYRSSRIADSSSAARASSRCARSRSSSLRTATASSSGSTEACAPQPLARARRGRGRPRARPRASASSSRSSASQSGSSSDRNVRRSDRSRRVATRAWCTPSGSLAEPHRGVVSDQARRPRPTSAARDHRLDGRRRRVPIGTTTSGGSVARG